tara:strand:+ start:95425 stop:95601 length:177 start_codon:yes stop_codon:yes gene_type:complete
VSIEDEQAETISLLLVAIKKCSGVMRVIASEENLMDDQKRHLNAMAEGFDLIIEAMTK